MAQNEETEARQESNLGRAKILWEEARKAGGATPQRFHEIFLDRNSGAFMSAAEANKSLEALVGIIDRESWSGEEKSAARQAAARLAFGYKDDSDLERAEIAFDERDLYRPSGMPSVIFPKKSFSLIGARTGRGKTTFAATLLLDVLKNTGRQAVFLTFEETWEQVRRRIYNALLFSNALETGDMRPVRTERSLAQLAGFFRHPERSPFYSEIAAVRKCLRAWEDEGRLQVYDLDRRTIKDMERLLRLYPGAFVLVDYVTKIRPEGETAAQSRLDGFSDIADRLESLAKENGQTVIAAAQLRRADSRIASDSDTPDTLNDTMLKECGKFEEVANTIVFLGRNTAQRHNENIPGHDTGEAVYFWKIIKNRGGGGVNDSYLFDTRNKAMAYSLMKPLEPAVRCDRLTNDKSCALEGPKGNARKDAHWGGAGATPPSYGEQLFSSICGGKESR